MLHKVQDMKTKIAFLSLLLTVVFGVFYPASAVTLTIKNQTLFNHNVEVPMYNDKIIKKTMKMKISKGEEKVIEISNKKYTSYQLVLPGLFTCGNPEHYSTKKETTLLTIVSNPGELQAFQFHCHVKWHPIK